MKQTIWGKFIPVEPRPANISLSKSISATEQRQLIQSYLPGLPKPLSGETRFGVKIAFYINGNKSKRHPKTDLDNLIKGLIDNVTGFFWIDDSQIDEIQAKITRQASKAGINLKVYKIEQNKRAIAVKQ